MRDATWQSRSAPLHTDLPRTIALSGESVSSMNPVHETPSGVGDGMGDTHSESTQRLEAFVREILCERAHDGVSLLTITLPVPLCSLSELLGRPGLDPEVVWCPPATGQEPWGFIGTGIAWRMSLSGEDRFKQLHSASKVLFQKVSRHVHPACIVDCQAVTTTPSGGAAHPHPTPSTLAAAVLGGESPLGPRLFGGLAFDVQGANEAPWIGFGDGSFCLPRWTYASDGKSACLTLSIRPEAMTAVQQNSIDTPTGAPEQATDKPSVWHDADPEGRRQLAEVSEGLEQVLSELRQWIQWLEGSISAITLPPAQHMTLTQLPEERWTALVQAVRNAIHDGRFQKVVLARRAEVSSPQPWDIAAILQRLLSDFPSCVVFAFRQGDGVFLGATPEQLLTRKSSYVRTEALAGSSLSTAADQDERLLKSAKDREEHRLVVEQIEACLRPLCARLEMPEVPHIRRLRHVLHLQTPIVGWLDRNVHVLELVEALHPTPAVGGVPARQSVAWIRRLEPVARGWYAGPIGWCDPNGDGSFWVALRSGLIRGSSAWLYAGAGIMGDSDPHHEYLETALKQRAILTALGVET